LLMSAIQLVGATRRVESNKGDTYLESIKMTPWLESQSDKDQ
jgi:hypothetical protein